MAKDIDKVITNEKGEVTVKLTKKRLYNSFGDIDERNSKIIGVFESNSAATEYAKGKGYYGSNGTVSETEAFVDEDGRIWTPGGILTERQAGYDKEIIDGILGRISPEDVALIHKHFDLLKSTEEVKKYL